jgi:hypothetical protein
VYNKHKLIVSSCLLLFTAQLQANNELIIGGGTSGDVQPRKWSLLGKTYGSQNRMYNGNKYLYITAKQRNAGIYQSFPTKIGKTYMVSAFLLGTDVNQKKKFTSASSYITINNSVPTPSVNPEHQSRYVTGSAEKKISFEFIATSTTSYIAVRSSKAWNYGNARAISVKEK